MLNEYLPNASGVKNRAIIMGTIAIRTWPAARNAAKLIKTLPSLKLFFSEFIIVHLVDFLGAVSRLHPF